VETANSHPAAALPPGFDNPTDRLICGLLAVEPMPSPEIAARLAIPPRTARHRLMRLRDAGTVAVDDDGFYRLVGLAAAGLPAVATPGGQPAAAGATPVTGGNPAAWAAVLIVAAGCAGAVIWAASRMAATKPLAPPAPPATPFWQYGAGWRMPGGW
jgi:hypothetical protein